MQGAVIECIVHGYFYWHQRHLRSVVLGAASAAGQPAGAKLGQEYVEEKLAEFEQENAEAQNGRDRTCRCG